jgi:hypothetical protein
MSDGIKILLVALGAGLASYVAIIMNTTLCANTTGWGALIIFLYCTMFPVSVVIAAVVVVLKLVQNV